MDATSPASSVIVQRVVSAKALGHLSYVVAARCPGNSTMADAVVVDPVPDVSLYREAAATALGDASVEIRWRAVLLTHLPEDVVSGHAAVAAAVGAPVINATSHGHAGAFPLFPGRDDVQLRVMPTPGHTQDSCCFLVANTYLFTGDTVLCDSIGIPGVLHVRAEEAKPDRAVANADYARAHFASLRRAVDPLPDATFVLPGHTQGATLVALAPFNAAMERDTLAGQRRTNWALRPGITQEEFVAEVQRRVAGMVPTPRALQGMVLRNATSNELQLTRGRDGLLGSPRGLAVSEFQAHYDAFVARPDGAGADPSTWVIDVRSNAEFCAGHIPGSVYMGLDGGVELWLTLLLRTRPSAVVMLVVGSAELDDALRRFAMAGVVVTGYLEGGVDAWVAAGRSLAPRVAEATPADTAAALRSRETNSLVDCRFASEWRAGHVAGAVFHPLHAHRRRALFDEPAAEDDALLDETPAEHRVFVQCRLGYRSLILISLEMLRRLRRGRRVDEGPTLVNVVRGWTGLQELPEADRPAVETA